VKRFSQAIIKAALLIRYNPQAGARAPLTARGAPFTDADLMLKASELTAWEDYLPASDPTNRRIGAITEPGIQVYIDLLKGAGVIKAAIPASEVVTDDLIAPANDFDHRSVEALANSK